MIGLPTSWRGTKDVDQAKQLIDFGVMLQWRDMRTMMRSMSEEEQEQVVRHFAKRFGERHGARLQAEIIVESLMIWLAHASSEKLLFAFLEEFFAQPGCDQACWQLVEIALTSEVSENDHDQDIFEMSVALVCELGISIQEYENAYPGEFQKAQAFLDHLATYLLSVSNANSTCIRLSLLHYFGVTESNVKNKIFFNRIMGRFGHTVLDHLFHLLFHKRTEAVALQYLLENLPFVLNGDRHSQKIIHETFKFYMLKQPERFALFAQNFADELLTKGEEFTQARLTYIQHLSALLKVVSDVNHKLLGRELMLAVIRFKHIPQCCSLLEALRDNGDFRKNFKELLAQLIVRENSEEVVESIAQFRSNKRGRKPSFARVENCGTLHQVNYLGGAEISKAS